MSERPEEKDGEAPAGAAQRDDEAQATSGVGAGLAPARPEEAPQPAAVEATRSAASETAVPASPRAGTSPAPTPESRTSVARPAEQTTGPVPTAASVDYHADVRRELARLSRRGFFTLAAGGAAAVLGWRYLISRPGEQGIPWPFRRVLQTNEALWEALWNPARRAPSYPRSAAARFPRINGMLGLDVNADPAAWHLVVEGAAAGPLTLGLADIQALPAHDLVTELRCVEGWSIVVHWTGARLSDFIARYPPAARDGSPADPATSPERLPPFLALETPGRGYYVGLDLQSALHPQTLLA
ncbi:MAG TPA: molybdopterin-dependent oxidoreductase, partial [Thermoanaerobaculia bacterium]|nr:molybdopterin-dependent oxidoreductase [Thermoanaerobaculia bacterium]